MAEASKKEVAVASRNSSSADAPMVFHPFADWERMFDEIMSRGWMRPLQWDSSSFPRFPRLILPSFEATGAPRVDVIDRNEEIAVRAELPGVEKEDVSITLADAQITIKAAGKREAKNEQGEYRRAEMYRGSYQRVFALPSAVDETKARASMKDGILEIVIPKAEETKRHTVKVD